MVDIARLEGMTNEEATAYLSRTRGIGCWSAEYALLRGLGRLTRSGRRHWGTENRLQRLFHLTDRPAYDHIRHLTSPWHPCEGRCLFHLLLDRLGAKGGSYESGMLQEVITNRFELFRTSDCRERRRARTQRGLGRVLVTE